MLLRRLIPRTVLGQLIAGTVLIQTVVLLVFLAVSIQQQVREQRTRDEARVESQSSLLARTVVHAVETSDLVEMQKLLETARTSPTISVARITDPAGHTLAVSQGAPTDLSAEEYRMLLNRPAEDRLKLPGLTVRERETMKPVMIDGKTVALVWVKPDASLTRRTLDEVVRNSLSYGLCAMLANIFLVAVLARTVSQPLRRLQKATQRMVRDPGDTAGFPLPSTSSNEAGDLTQSFNTMVRDLEQQRNGLQETLALLDSMLINAPIGFAFFDRRHRYVRINDHLAGLNGLRAEEHLAHTPVEIFDTPLAAEMESVIEQVFESGEDVHDLQLDGALQVGGEERTWICNFYTVRTSHARVRWVGLVVSDATNRVRAEEAMRKSEKLAAAGRLAASIAHEINNPLESVTNLLYLLRTNPSLSEEAEQYAELAQRELGRVSEITQQTLRFYRSSARPGDVSLPELMNSVLALHAGRVGSVGVVVMRRLDEDAQMFGFSGELRQLLANLVGNAVDAMTKGGKLYVRARRIAYGGRAGVTVTVADTGTGMSKATLRRIFEPFYTTKDATGTGLGLWVSEEIVTKHGGKVQVRSRTDEGASGTVFRISFPAEEA